jgi:hypothetical protein
MPTLAGTGRGIERSARVVARAEGRRNQMIFQGDNGAMSSDRSKDDPEERDESVPPKPPRPPDSGDKPAVPEQSREDTDSAWGDRAEPSDEERFYRDRPPHWGSD